VLKRLTAAGSRVKECREMSFVPGGLRARPVRQVTIETIAFGTRVRRGAFFGPLVRFSKQLPMMTPAAVKNNVYGEKSASVVFSTAAYHRS